MGGENKSEIAKIIEKDGNEENARLVKQGKKEGIKSMMKRLYDMKFPIEQIAQAAELDVKEVKKILEIED